MRGRSVRRRLLVVAALVLAALCVGLAEESFFHTDDGCPVETHCLACRLATGTVAILSAVAAPVPSAPARAERVWTDRRPTRSESVVPITPSRAPPLV